MNTVSPVKTAFDPLREQLIAQDSIQPNPELMKKLMALSVAVDANETQRNAVAAMLQAGAFDKSIGEIQGERPQPIAHPRGERDLAANLLTINSNFIAFQAAVGTFLAKLKGALGLTPPIAQPA